MPYLDERLARTHVSFMGPLERVLICDICGSQDHVRSMQLGLYIDCEFLDDGEIKAYLPSTESPSDICLACKTAIEAGINSVIKDRYKGPNSA